MKRLKSLISVSLVFICLFSLAGCGSKSKKKINEEPATIMECKVNPEVQFVLNGSDQVIDVIYLNEDAEKLLLDVNFYGMEAEKAAESLISLATEAGYVTLATTVADAEKVDITFSVKSNINQEKIDALKTKVVNQVNSYFDREGIVGAAVAQVQEGFSSAVTKIGIEATTIQGMTEEEILEFIKETSKQLEEVSIKAKDSVIETINSSRSLYKQSIETIEGLIDQYESQLDNLVIESMKPIIEASLKQAREQLELAKKTMDQSIDSAIASVKEISDDYFEQFRSEINTAKENTKSLIEDHKEYYTTHKEAVDAAIKAYRESLNS